MPSVFDFAHLYEQEELSDVALIISAQPQDDDPAVVCKKMPAHSVILSSSPFMRAMIVRWQHKRKHEDSTSSSSRGDAARCEVVLTLQDETQLPAALTVLQALYAVQPLPQLLSELPQEQQLQVALLADMWQIPKVTTAAVEELVGASKLAHLTDALLQQYMSLETYPTCILPLLRHLPAAVFSTEEHKPKIKHVLLSVLGDLEDVWADAALQDTLLKLPVPAMELLLSYDELKVASEDTVLYTVQTYINKMQPSGSPASVAVQKDAARQKLAVHIRCPHLSQFWLTAAVLAPSTATKVLAELQAQLKQLVLARQAEPGSSLPSDVFLHEVTSAPRSWSLPPRNIQQLDEVQLQWSVSVADIRNMALKSSSATRRYAELNSSACTPPFGGITWRLQLNCLEGSERKGSKLGLFVVPNNVPPGMAHSPWMTVECVGHVVRSTGRVQRSNSLGRGWRDFFDVGFMPGGWVEAAWTAKGLPADGQLTFRLQIKAVGHA